MSAQGASLSEFMAMHPSAGEIKEEDKHHAEGVDQKGPSRVHCIYLGVLNSCSFDKSCGGQGSTMSKINLLGRCNLRTISTQCL